MQHNIMFDMQHELPLRSVLSSRMLTEYVLCQHNFNVHISKSIVSKVMHHDVIIYLAYRGLKYTTITLEIEMHENLHVYA